MTSTGPGSAITMAAELPRRRLVAALGAGAGALFLPTVALGRDRSIAERYRKPTAGSDIDTGGAIIGVNAPLAKVLRVVTRYDRYDQILPRLEQSRIVGKTPQGGTDVYVRAPILRGVAHVWGVGRFTKPRRWGKAGKVIVGSLVKGNLEAWNSRWVLHPCSPTRTILRFEMFAMLIIPVPTSQVTPELMWASDMAVTAVRDMAECGRSTVAND
jgi:hypothetical protein